MAQDCGTCWLFGRIVLVAFGGVLRQIKKSLLTVGQLLHMISLCLGTPLSNNYLDLCRNVGFLRLSVILKHKAGLKC
jgi:hypothetical protein